MTQYIDEINTNNLTVGNRTIYTDRNILDTHVASVDTVHGVVSNVVGTTDSQILTNKTISHINNTLDISTNNISSGTLGVNRGGTGQTSLSMGSWLVGNGTNPITQIKNNMNANTAPGVTDDSDSGYSVGSNWIDISVYDHYICLSATVGVAIWKKTNILPLTIQYNGTNVQNTPHSILNFIGSGVSVSNVLNAGNNIATVNIIDSIGGGGPISGTTVSGIFSASTTSSVYVNIPDLTITMTTGTNIFMIANVPLSTSNSNSDNNIRIIDSDLGIIYAYGSYLKPARNFTIGVIAVCAINTIIPGLHTFKVQWKTTSGTLSTVVNNDNNRYFTILTLN